MPIDCETIIMISTTKDESFSFVKMPLTGKKLHCKFRHNQTYMG